MRSGSSAVEINVLIIPFGYYRMAWGLWVILGELVQVGLHGNRIMIMSNNCHPPFAWLE
jgi:hypothetical protein